jgi:hypothetical protein
MLETQVADVNSASRGASCIGSASIGLPYADEQEDARCMIAEGRPPCPAQLLFSRNARYAEIDEDLAGLIRKVARKCQAVLALGSNGIFLERRDQFSASAIQSARLEGSCLASCLHSAARELNSNQLVIGTPA